MDDNLQTNEEVEQRFEDNMTPDSDRVENQDIDLGEQVPEVVPETIQETPVDDWSPDYNFKVMDEEKEFDDFIKPIVNKENQAQIRELYEKAHGIDHVKTKYATLKEQNAEYAQKYNAQSESLGYMGKLIDEKNYGTLFNELKISDEDIMNHALQKIEYQNLPPEEREAQDRATQDNQKLQNLEYENNLYKQQHYEDRTQTRVTDLNNYLASDEVKSVMEDFDTRSGKPGSFRNEVIQRGKMAFALDKRDISVADAVNEVMGLYGNRPSQEQAPVTQTQPVIHRQKPVIPNVRAGGHSPARKAPGNLEELRALSKQYER